MSQCSSVLLLEMCILFSSGIVICSTAYRTPYYSYTIQTPGLVISFPVLLGLQLGFPNANRPLERLATSAHHTKHMCASIVELELVQPWVRGRCKLLAKTMDESRFLSPALVIVLDR